MDKIIFKRWFFGNSKWMIPLIGIIALIIVIFSSPVGSEIKGIAAVYTESSVYKNALDKANINEEVIEKLGVLDEIDFLAIVEGSIKYSNNNNTIDASFRVKGTKGRGRIAISADRNNKEWIYRKIYIGIKKPKTTIIVLK